MKSKKILLLGLVVLSIVTGMQFISTEHISGEDYRLVTWEQKDHPLWFGSQINGALKRVERVSTALLADGSVKMYYELVQGAPAAIDQQERITFILAQKASVFP